MNSAKDHTGVLQIRDGTLFVNNSSFVNNTATRHSGVIDNSNVSITASTFADNRAIYKGGVLTVNDDSTLIVEDSIFRNNTSGNRGGVMVVYDSLTMISLCQFISNHSVHLRTVSS